MSKIYSVYFSNFHTETHIPETHKGLFFGETPFTSFYIEGGRVSFLENHLLRLKRSITFLYPDREDDYTLLDKLVGKQLKKIKEDAYVRITCWEDFSGNLGTLISVSVGEQPNLSSVKMVLAQGSRGEGIMPSFLKVGQYLESRLELREARSVGADEVLYLNGRRQVLEASTSNIFAIIKGKIVTPAISYGVLDGITRFHLIECLRERDINVEERVLSIDELLLADEIWLTNSRGIRSVSHFMDKELKMSVIDTARNLFTKYKERYYGNLAKG